MISVDDARDRILAGLKPTPAETVAVSAAAGRVLATDVAARATQPPVAVSAMDGYAVRAADVAATPATLRVIGEVPAGGQFAGTVGAGDAVRIFTGAAVPAGADAVVIQEDTDRDGDALTVKETAAAGAFVRPAGLDFAAGDDLLSAGRVLTARDVGLAAAMDVPWLAVRRRPRVALLATGDEIVMPGEPKGPAHITSSNTFALSALVTASGGEAVTLGIARDNPESLSALAAAARGADLLVTTGGASVGDHDLVQAVLGEHGLDIDFWRIAMRPGKPLMFGQFNGVPMLGLPGNPVSTVVCGLVFLRPALRHMLGVAAEETTRTATLGRDLPANDRRQDYLRASLTPGDDGRPVATPFDVQDSSMLATLARADALVVRPPNAPAIAAGEAVPILPFAVGPQSI